MYVRLNWFLDAGVYKYGGGMIGLMVDNKENGIGTLNSNYCWDSFQSFCTNVLEKGMNPSDIGK